MPAPVNLPAWKALAKHSLDSRDTHMRDLFAKDPNRATTLSHRWNDLFLDYSKNRVTSETLNLLRQLLKEAKVEELRDRMF
jgi:glucose-6-phosphate isomerase